MLSHIASESVACYYGFSTLKKVFHENSSCNSKVCIIPEGPYFSRRVDQALLDAALLSFISIESLNPQTRQYRPFSSLGTLPADVRLPSIWQLGQSTSSLIAAGALLKSKRERGKSWMIGAPLPLSQVAFVGRASVTFFDYLRESSDHPDFGLLESSRCERHRGSRRTPPLRHTCSAPIFGSWTFDRPYRGTAESASLLRPCAPFSTGGRLGP